MTKIDKEIAALTNELIDKIILKTVPNVDCAHYRGSDGLDFHDVSILTLRELVKVSLEEGLYMGIELKQTNK
tara:strand:+ start:77507 stop:77722 length:216 start_codon:yes stop_codon:yes gene_type:complete